jgi:NADH-quinone oxidoreductase subunit H
MSAVAVALVGLKAFLVVMFAMNVGVVLTWADRRQGAMIQDRVGPNRAVAPIPTPLAQAALVLPALAIAAGVLYWVYTSDVTGGERTARAMLLSQLAILWIWLTTIVIAARVQRRGVKSSFDGFIRWLIDGLGSVRRIAYVGLAAHVLTFFVAATLRGTDEGRLLRDIAYGAGAALFAAMVVGGALYAAWSIRKEKRVGVRLAGLLHPAADGLKTLFKEDFIPPNADRLLHSLAPIISFFPALVVLAVVPFGDTLCFHVKNETIQLTQLLSHVPADGMCAGGAVPLQVVNLNVGILYFFALAGTGIVGAALAGWASDNKFSLLGGVRAASQMVSYEVTLGMTLIGALMIYGTVRIDEMVRWQAEHAWGIFVQPLAFILFFTAAVAESKRIPFDLPEGESEIVAGYYTEYAGMKFAMFFFAEYIAVVASSALMAALFLGGWHLPFLERDGLNVMIGDTQFFYLPLSHGFVVLLGVLAFIFKTIALCWVQLTIRWTLPRFRYDQLMKLGWRKLLPASLVNILATGLVILAVQAGDAGVINGLSWLGDMTMAIVAIVGAIASIYFIAFLFSPPRKRRLLASTSAQFAAAAGGTRTARMGA